MKKMILNILHEEQLEDFTLNELRGGTGPSQCDKASTLCKCNDGGTYCQCNGAGSSLCDSNGTCPNFNMCAPNFSCSPLYTCNPNKGLN